MKKNLSQILKRFLFPNIVHPGVADFILASNKYGAYCIPASAGHRPAAKTVMAGDVWEQETIEFMIENCKAGDVITAGTFFGDALPALSRATASHGAVWGFEPNPESYRCSAITALLNDLKNVKLTNAALGERSETRNLVVRDFTGRPLGGASQIDGVMDYDGKRGTDTVPINVVTIDDVVPVTTAVSILHLDIEGFEEYALAGAVRTIKRCRPFLILETVPKPDSIAARFLESLKYRITRPLSSENVLLEC